MDLKRLIEAFEEEKEINIIKLDLSTKCIFEGRSSNFNCKKNEYEVIKLEKNSFDSSYSIFVI